MRFNRVAQRYGAVDPVKIATPFLDAGDDLGGLEIDEDLRNRTFRDADGLRKIANPQLGISRKRDEHVRVIAQEGPAGTWFHPPIFAVDTHALLCFIIHEICFM